MLAPSGLTRWECVKVGGIGRPGHGLDVHGMAAQQRRSRVFVLECRRVTRGTRDPGRSAAALVYDAPTVLCRRLSLRLLAVVLLAALAATACLPDYEGPDGARKVYVFGDSLPFTAAFSGELRTQFIDHGFRVASYTGIAVTTGNLLPHIALAPTMTPDVVVLASATTDTTSVVVQPDGEPADRKLLETWANLGRAIDSLASVPCIVLTGANTHTADPAHNIEASRYNWGLVYFALTRPNVRLFNWSSYSEGRPYWFTDDGTHLTTSGKSAFARGMAESAKTC
ncbi:MAG: hypothetical protein N2037_02690 [Acidimicrobiales bacterium]|nr:hypothetical protein [Acidimicrobiales bacterium]